MKEKGNDTFHLNVVLIKFYFRWIFYNWLIFTAYQPVLCYFMPKGSEIAFLLNLIFRWIFYDWLILMAYQPVLCYFMPKGSETAFIVGLISWIGHDFGYFIPIG